jgi:hypothetical protein
MKKFLLWIVAIAICMGAFAGCSSTATDSTEQMSEETSAPQEASESAPTAAETAAPSTSSPELKPGFNLTAQIEEQELYNEGGIVVKALSLETAEVENEDGEYKMLGLICSIENQSSTAITPKLFTISINGKITSDYTTTVMSDDAAYEGATKSWFEPGEAATCAFTVGYIEDPSGYAIPLADMGITDIANISFDLALTNPDSDEWDNFIVIKPVSINTNIGESYTQSKPGAEDKVIYDDNGIRILCLGLSELTGDIPSEYNEQKWSAVDLYIENNRTENISVEVSEDLINVNGIACEGLFGAGWLFPTSYISPGAGAFTRFYLYKMHYDDYFDVSFGTLEELKCSFIIRPLDYVPYSGTADMILVQTPELTMKF